MTSVRHPSFRRPANAIQRQHINSIQSPRSRPFDEVADRGPTPRHAGTRNINGSYKNRRRRRTFPERGIRRKSVTAMTSPTFVWALQCVYTCRRRCTRTWTLKWCLYHGVYWSLCLSSPFSLETPTGRSQFVLFLDEEVPRPDPVLLSGLVPLPCSGFPSLCLIIPHGPCSSYCFPSADTEVVHVLPSTAEDFPTSTRGTLGYRRHPES